MFHACVQRLMWWREWKILEFGVSVYFKWPTDTSICSHLILSRLSNLYNLLRCYRIWQTIQDSTIWQPTKSCYSFFNSCSFRCYNYSALHLLVPCLIYHRFISVSNFATSMSLILFATLSVAATVCRRSNMTNFYGPTKQALILNTERRKMIRLCKLLLSFL
jgi:hypothetical protein